MDISQEKHVVTCFLECQGRILLLKRSQQVGTFRGLWAGISGYVEDSADEQSLVEITEETGLSPRELTLVKIGKPVTVDDIKTGVHWVVHPYLYKTGSAERIRTDWEHCDSRWVKPEELESYHTVPALKEAFLSVFEPKQ